VEGNREFHDPEVGRQVATGLGDLVEKECSDLAGELSQFAVGEVVEIGRVLDPERIMRTA
jgi:hypothetical protein